MRKVWTSPESMAVNDCGIELYLNLYLRIVPQRQYYLASARERWKVLLSRISYSIWGGKPHVMQREWYYLRDMLGHSIVCIPCLRCRVSDILERCVETYRIRLIIERALILKSWKNMNIVLVGIQWSGKGTQARLLCEHYPSYVFFEMGQKLRNFAKTGHPMASKLEEDMKTWRLIDDEIIGAMLNHYKDEHTWWHILFDGVPRTFGQKALFDQIFPDYLVVFLDLKQDIAIDRLSNRRIDPENGASFSKDFEWDYSPFTGNRLIKREDDTPEAAKIRIDGFYENTLPLLAEWASEGKRVYRIDASGTPNEVFSHIQVILSAYLYQNSGI